MSRWDSEFTKSNESIHVDNKVFNKEFFFRSPKNQNNIGNNDQTVACFSKQKLSKI